MPRFACPGCKKILSVPEEGRGAFIVCPKCNRKLRIPKKTSPDSSKVASSAVKPKRPAEPSSRSRPVLQASSKDKDSEVFDIDEKDLEVDDDRKFEGLDKFSGGRFKGPTAKPKTSEEDEITDVDPGVLDVIEDEETTPARRPKKLLDDDAEEKPKRRKKKKHIKGAHGTNKGGAATAGTVGGIGAVVMLGILYLFVTGKWIDYVWDPLQGFLEDQGIHPILALGATAVIVLIPVGIVVLMTLKSTIVNALPDYMDFVPADELEFGDLNIRKLRTYTEAFERLGFKHLMDYKVKADIHMPDGFARLMYHPNHDCFAEINQPFPDDGTSHPVRCMVLSLFDDGWSLSMSDRKVPAEYYLMRRPKAVFQSLKKKSPEEILEAHLKFRRQMARDLDAKALTKLTMDDYFESERDACTERKQIIRKRNIIAMLIELWTFNNNPKRKWLGDYKDYQ